MSGPHYVTREEFKLGFDLEAGRFHKVVLITIRRACLQGGFFELNKCFVPPVGLLAAGKIAQLANRYPKSALLVVGHTDRSGEPAFNDVLSLERAQSMTALLGGDVDTWLAHYDQSSSAKRWGETEDKAMLGAITGADPGTKLANAVRAFQQSRGLQVDGIAGPQTRTQLIVEYMALVKATLPEGVTVTAHGCGENFPLDPNGQELAVFPRDGERDALDRRIEVFFFPVQMGIDPPPPQANSAAGSTEYPTWRRRSTLTACWSGPGDDSILALPVEDLVFCSNSAVFLPAADPTRGSVTQRRRSGLVALVSSIRALRRDGRKLLLAGHATSDEESAETLSAERARNVHLFLSGDKQGWAKHCTEFGTNEDLDLVLRWAAAHYPLGCKPSESVNLTKALEFFRRDHDQIYATSLPTSGGVSADDWEALYDRYLQQLELLLSGVKLTEVLKPEDFHESVLVGCGTRFPAIEVNDDAGLDASDRRVDLLLVPATLRLDVTLSPPGKDIYGPGRDVRYIPFDDVGPLLVITNDKGEPLSNATVELLLESGAVVEKVTDVRGAADVKDVPQPFTVRKVSLGDSTHFANHMGPTLPA